MTIGDPIEEQCVRMWRTVYVDEGMELDEARHFFWKQNHAVIEGLERLARGILAITTVNTIEHVARVKR